MESNPLPGAVPSPFIGALKPSPFVANKKDLDNTNAFLKEVEALGKKYGFNQVFLACGKSKGDDTTDWFAQSNVVSEGMLICLKDSIFNMQKFIDEQNDEPTTV